MPQETKTTTSYKLEKIKSVLESMIKIVRTYDQDLKGEFVTEHPWSGIYMGFFPESDKFLRLAAHPDHRLEVIDVHEEEVKRRIQKKEGAVIRYRLSAPNDREVVIFSFVADSNGDFFYEDLEE